MHPVLSGPKGRGEGRKKAGVTKGEWIIQRAHWCMKYLWEVGVQNQIRTPFVFKRGYSLMGVHGMG